MIQSPVQLDRKEALAWYRKNRARTAQLFDLLTDDAYYAQPIALRHPIVFYEGHIPAFSLNTLVKRAHGKSGIDERLERLFARGIDPDESVENPSSSIASQWPTREEVRAFVRAADDLVIDALEKDPLDIQGHPLLAGADAVYTILEHEAMHQETLLYMWHRLPHAQKRAPVGYRPVTTGPSVDAQHVELPGATVRLGVTQGGIPFGWDNELGSQVETVSAFSVSRYDVSNEEYLEFVNAGGYAREDCWPAEDWAWLREHDITHPVFWDRVAGEWLWRGMFENMPLPLQWPVYASHAEASAYARWRGRRLPTEAELVHAATPFPRTGLYDFVSWDPLPVAHPLPGSDVNGLAHLVGNGWKWTSSVFAPFAGYQQSASYPEYSSDFFDGSHYVMKGASTVTARELVRPTFRNWFRPRYPYVYAAVRLAGNAS